MDIELRRQVLRASIRDAQFLKASARDIDGEDFPDAEEQVIAAVSAKFWDEYQEPIGALVRSYADEEARKQKLNIEQRRKMTKLLDTVLGPDMPPVSVRALQERVHALKQNRFYENAVEKIITQHEKGSLTAIALQELVEQAQRELTFGMPVSTDYLANEEFIKRIHRRRRQAEEMKFPLTLIDGLDQRIRVLPRGHVGLILAPYSSGKGMALVHLTVAHAMQGLNVVYLTLEDSKEEVEDRLDSSLTGIPKTRLRTLPNRLKNRWVRARRKLRGRIKIIDGCDEDWTVTRVEKMYDQFKSEGWIPDVIIIDYDDELKCEKEFKGESARRFEFAHIYRLLRKAAVRMNVWLWTAAQTGKQAEGRKVVTGRDAAEDVSKIRKVAFAMGLGTDPDNAAIKHLYIIRHKFDRSRFGIDIVSDFESSIFYDKEASIALRRARRAQARAA